MYSNRKDAESFDYTSKSKNATFESLSQISSTYHLAEIQGACQHNKPHKNRKNSEQVYLPLQLGDLRSVEIRVCRRRFQFPIENSNMQAMKQRHQPNKGKFRDKNNEIAIALRKTHLRVQSNNEQVHRTGDQENVDCETDNMPQAIPNRGAVLDTFTDLKMLP